MKESGAEGINPEIARASYFKKLLREVNSLWERVPENPFDGSLQQFSSLVEEPGRAFSEALGNYVKIDVNTPQVTLSTRQDELSKILKNYTYVFTSEIPQEGHKINIPMATLMEIANRSKIGIYTKDSPVSIEYPVITSFNTISHSEYWRHNLGEWAKSQAERILAKTGKIDMVMIGDGLGLMGKTILEVIGPDADRLRIIHIDIGERNIDIQRRSYESTGISPKKVVSIKGDITELHSVLEQVPDFKGGIFFIQEVTDVLKTHALMKSHGRLTEMYLQTDPDFKSERLQPAALSDKTISDMIELLPKYKQIVENNGILPFSPEILIAIEEMMKSSDHSIIYVGDYVRQFVFNEFSKIPYRTYGRLAQGEDDYLGLYEHDVCITTDVDPGVIGYANFFGGKVEFLGFQRDFMEFIDPNYKNYLQERIKILTDPEFSYEDEQTDDMFIEDKLIISKVDSPIYFAGVISKGM